MRTSDEILAAVERLKLNKQNCEQFNFFGIDNHASIDIMIDVIEHNRSEEYVYSKYPSVDDKGKECFVSHNKWQSAIIGLNFLRGRHKLEDLLYPEN